MQFKSSDEKYDCYAELSRAKIAPAPDSHCDSRNCNALATLIFLIEIDGVL